MKVPPYYPRITNRGFFISPAPRRSLVLARPLLLRASVERKKLSTEHPKPVPCKIGQNAITIGSTCFEQVQKSPKHGAQGFYLGGIVEDFTNLLMAVTALVGAITALVKVLRNKD